MKQKFTKLTIIVMFFLGISLQLNAQMQSTVDKTAQSSVDTNGNIIPNTWDITLKIDAGSIKTTENVPTDLVLVIDKSGSMQYADKMKETKAAAKLLVNDLINKHPKVRIGIVTYDTNVRKVIDFTNNITNLENKINSIGTGGNTFTQGGIHQAREMLAGSTATNKHIILLADGIASRQYKLKSPTINDFIKYGSGNPYVDNLLDIVHDSYVSQQNINVNGDFIGKWYSSMQKYNFPESKYDYNIATSFEGVLYMDKDLTNKTSQEYYYEVPGLAAINEAKFAKDEGVTVHTIILGLDSTKPDDVFGRQVMKETASSESTFYDVTPSDIGNAFSTIANYITPEITFGVLEDFIGDGFVLQDINNSNDITSITDISSNVRITSTSTTHGTKSVLYDKNEDKITWNFDITDPDEVITLTYRLFLDTTGAHGDPVVNNTSTQGPDIGGYDTNKSAILTYDGDRTKEFPRPTVKSSIICEISPNTGTAGRSTHVGISTLNRNTDEWLKENNNMGAYLVLESTTKGLVVPRFENQDAIDNGIGSDTAAGVEEGMIVWSKQNNCFKMFFDNNGDGIMTWNCISYDSCTNSKP